MEAVQELSEYEVERGKPMPGKNHALAQYNLTLAFSRYGAEHTILPELTLDLEPRPLTPDLSRLSGSDKKRPSLHAGRARRTAAEFARTFFIGSHSEAARRVFLALERLTGRDLSGLEPDDRIGDLIGPPDSLDRVEAVMDRSSEEEHGAVDQDPGALYWLSVLGELLGEARSTSSWDPETIPLRSVRGVVAERARHTSLETGPG